MIHHSPTSPASKPPSLVLCHDIAHATIWPFADDDDAPPRRRRRSSVTALIKQARKAGERGPVRVELPDGTAITSNSEPVAGQSDDDAERLWLERIAKRRIACGRWTAR